MNRYSQCFFVRSLSVAASLALSVVVVTNVACSSQHPKPQNDSARGQESNNSSKAAEADPGIDLNCVYDRIQNPKEAFSYSYTKDIAPDDHLSEEADITPQSIDGRYRSIGQDHVTAIQAQRSQQQDWSAAVAHLTAISGMSSTIALVNHGSAMKRESDGGQVNGYQTIHYSIDTARFDDVEKKLLGSTMGPGGFEKGDAWVTSEGCPVKIVLDDEMRNKDGTPLQSIHYEEAMVKK